MTRWQDLSSSPTLNVHPLGAHLVDVLWAEEALDLLPGYGWLDGGCLVLCCALQQWSGGVLSPCAWVRNTSDGDQRIDHWAVSTQIESEHLFLDGDGLGTEADLVAKMTLEGRADGQLVLDAGALFALACDGKRPIEEANLYPGHPVNELVRHLNIQLGAFSLDHIVLGWPDRGLGLPAARQRSLTAR